MLTPTRLSPLFATRFVTLLVTVPGAVLAALTACAAAQNPDFGDYLLTEAGPQARGVVHVDRVARTITKWPEPPVGHVLRGVQMDALSNQSALAVLPGRASRAGEIVLASQVANFTASTLAPGLAPVDIANGQDGSVLVLTSGGQLYRYYYYNRYNNIVISWLPRNLTALTIDGDTGDYVVSTAGGLLLRVDPVSRAIATIASGLGATADVDFDPFTGGFVVATSASPGVRLISRAGALVRGFTVANASAVRIDPDRGTIHAAGGDTIFAFARNGAALDSVRFPGYAFTSLELHGTSKVNGGGIARPRNNYFFTFRYPRTLANQPYFAAMSLSGLRPGIAVAGGRRISLVPDPLFNFTTAFGDLPTISWGMHGTLQASGRGSVRIVAPSGVPYGVRLWASVVVLDASAPGGIDTANTVGMTFRPSTAP